MTRMIKKMLMLLVLYLLLGYYRVQVICVPFSKVSEGIGNQKPSSMRIPNRQALHRAVVIGDLTGRISRFTPWKSTCLVNARTVQRVLKWLRISHSLILGMRKDADGRLEAHAWVACGKCVVIGGEQMTGYYPVSNFYYEPKEHAHVSV